VLHVVVPDRNLVPCELAERGKRAHRVEIIVEDRNLHAPRSARRRARSRAKLWRDLTHSRSRIEPAPAAESAKAPRARRRRLSVSVEPASPHRDAARLGCWNGAKSFLFNCLPRPIWSGCAPAAGASRGNTKQKFERTKPHCNVGTIGHVDHGK